MDKFHYCYKENLCIPLTFPVPPKYLPRLLNIVKKCPLCTTQYYFRLEKELMVQRVRVSDILFN